jgi:hypothetical protein
MKEKAMRKSFKRFAFTFFFLTITTFSKFFQAHFRSPLPLFSTTVIDDNVVVGIIVEG